MKNFSVCIISQHFKDPSALLETIRKMTPRSSGKWKDMEAVTDPSQADYVACVDGAHGGLKIPFDRTLYFAQHPKGCNSYTSMESAPAGVRRYPIDHFINPGEWWISYDYDTLMALKCPKKTKDLISISTYHEYPGKPTYGHRIRFLEEYSKKSKNIDIYGRQEKSFRSNHLFKDTYRGVAGIGEDVMDTSIGEHLIGKDIEISYRYALDFDIGQNITGLPTRNYFSERFYDSLLLWTMPLYFGSDNVHDFVPKNSFVYVDISGSIVQVNAEVDKAIAVVQSDFREQHIQDMAEARDLLLNKYQLWPFIYDKIKGLK